MGVQKQLADLHSQVKCLTEICSPQNVTTRRTPMRRRGNEDLTYENVSPHVPDLHNLTYTIERETGDLMMYSTSPLPPASLDKTSLSNFDLSQRSNSLQSISISDISHIPAAADNREDGQLNYSVSDIVAALHPSPEICPPPNTPVSVCSNTYMEIAESRILPCARRLFPVSSLTDSGNDLFAGRFPEAHSSPEAQPRVANVKRSHTITASSKSNENTRSGKKDTREFIFRRSSTRRSLKIPRKAKRHSTNIFPDSVNFIKEREDIAAEKYRKMERPACIGKEISTASQKRKHADSTYQSLIHFDMDESSSPPVYQPIIEISKCDTTTSSDATTFIEEPMCPPAVTQKTKSSKRKSISRELRRLGKNIQRFGAKKLKLETLAVL